MKPYKVYLNNKLFDIVYAANGTTCKKIKEQLVADGHPENLVVRHFMPMSTKTKKK